MHEHKSSPAEGHWASLPPDLLLAVFGLLELHDRVAVASACLVSARNACRRSFAAAAATAAAPRFTLALGLCISRTGLC